MCDVLIFQVGGVWFWGGVGRVSALPRVRFLCCVAVCVCASVFLCRYEELIPR